MTDAYIYDIIRSPRGRGRPDGALHATTAIDLSTQMLNAILARNDFDPTALEDVIWGNVTPVGEQGAVLARTAVLNSKIPESVPGLSINRFCASGLEAVNIAAGLVQSQTAEAFIAGGVEMMSRVPMGSDGAAIAADPQTAFQTNFVPQGISADLIATRYGYARAACDAFALASQERYKAAHDKGFFAKSLIPVRDLNGRVLLDHDEHPRETSLAALAALNPAFEAMGTQMPGFDAVAILKYPELERINHVHHAGNSSGIVDGAAAALIGSEAFGRKYGLKPRARFRAMARIGTDPTMNLTGPIPVTKRVLERAGMKVSDIDLFEVNEAFSSVVLHFMRTFDVPHARVNVNGGAIAMGHPLGATGCMILGTALDELERTGKERALVTLCVASGMGAATIIERV